MKLRDEQKETAYSGRLFVMQSERKDAISALEKTITAVESKEIKMLPNELTALKETLRIFITLKPPKSE